MDFQPVRRRELQMGQHLRLGLDPSGRRLWESAGGVDRRPAAKQPGAGSRRLDEDLAPRYRRVTGWSLMQAKAGYAGNVPAPLPTIQL